MCQGFSHFSCFMHHIVLAKLATTSIRVNRVCHAVFQPEPLKNSNLVSYRDAIFLTFYSTLSLDFGNRMYLV